MHIDSTYVSISRFFNRWVRLMEGHTRVMQVRDSDLGNANILIISAPTDWGIAALAQANARGKSCLLCFSNEVEAIALDHCRRHQIENLSTVVAPFFSIPFGSQELDAIYANCFFDLCDPEQIRLVLEEMGRALKQGGRLHSVNMAQPFRLAGHAWAWLFRRFPRLSHGFHPVDLVPSLLDGGFAVVQDRSLVRFGFPLSYLVAQSSKVA